MNLRLDRLVTLYLFSPLMRFSWGKAPAIPILMYHSISEDVESRVHPYYRTTTSPATFAAQMAYLHQNGYRTYSTTQVAELLKSDPGTARKSVVITFDDGYHDIYGEAFPVLSRFGFTATVFLPTSYIGKISRQFKGRDCLTWAEVRDLQRNGISFGSHTVTHPQLSNLDKCAIDTEVVQSKKTIEEETGCAVDSFAYPYSFPQTKTEFKMMLRDSLSRAGYSNGVCTVVGRAGCDSDPLFMERLPVNTSDDSALLRAKLNGAYDWIAGSQFAVKTAKDHAARITGFVKRPSGPSSVEL
jgi:peptidoglycan/xylan/chitin deacetylase (PgdA/CDA1 family)